MSTATPPAGFWHLIVGYDGSAPSRRAIDAAASLMQGRTGHIEVVYVAHLPGLAMFSTSAIAEVESDFDEVAQTLRDAAAEQLKGRVAAWQLRRREGIIPDQLIAAATELRDAHPGDPVTIVVGSSCHAAHRVAGSVAVSLARRSPVPVVIVP
jgi:nucleotide-binding universal stress UspA family protein